MNGEQVLKEVYNINKQLRELHLRIIDEDFDSSALDLETLDNLAVSIEHTHKVSETIYNIVKSKY